MINRAGAGVGPHWQNLEGVSLIDAGAATLRGNVYFFKEHLAITTNASGPWTFQEKDGRHADLICFDREAPKPIVVPLKFDLKRGEFTSYEIGLKNHGWARSARHWLMFAGNELILGHVDMPGFWIVPRTEIEAAVTREKEIRRRGDQEKATAITKRHQDLLARYDTNRDGRFSAAEKEQLFTDPNGLEELWPSADSNKNGFLDSADQLALFDINENGRCEPNELELLDKVQAIIARELLARFDTNGDGVLSENEFNEIPQPEDKARTIAARFSGMNWNAFDSDHNGKIDRSELEQLLRRRTQSSILSTLRNPLAQHLILMADRPGALSEAQKLQASAMLASAIESLWLENKAASK